MKFSLSRVLNINWRSQRSTIAVGLFVLVVVFLWAYVREIRLISKQPATIWTEDVTADCAVVLTGGPQRIREGIDLLSRKAVQKLIVSGVHPLSNLRDIFPQVPYYGAAVREQDVILERRSKTTFGNAQQTLPLVEALRCRDLVLITSRIHMRRAQMTFKGEFPQGFPIILRSVPAITEPASWDEVAWEALKSLFYSTWAY